MKVQSVETIVLQADVKRPFTSARGWWYRKKNAMLVKITTDDGVIGWGEAYGPPKISQVVVESLLKDVVIGADPFATKVLWNRMYSRIKDYGPRGMAIAALSAIDIALWDIIGKAIGRPVYDLLGGANRLEIPAYATGLYFYEDQEDHTRSAVDEAVRLKGLGFNKIKMKIGLGVEEDIARISAVMDAVGEDVRIMVDANHGYNVPNAIRLGRALEQLGVMWFEEPITPDDREGYTEVTRTLDIPVAGGENAFTRFEFKDIIAARAMDIIQPDVCCAGGITETARIVDMADTWNTKVVPHVWGTAIGMAASIHILAYQPASPVTWKPESPILEYEQTFNPFREAMITEPFSVKDGVVAAPTGPGLGITVIEEAFASYRVG